METVVEYKGCKLSKKKRADSITKEKYDKDKAYRDLIKINNNFKDLKNERQEKQE